MRGWMAWLSIGALAQPLILVAPARSEPALATGTLRGDLSYPSDYIPRDMKICAEAIAGGQIHCGAKKTSKRPKGMSYTLVVPAGRYHVFAETKDAPGTRAYYSDYVTCGIQAGCPSHKPIPVVFGPGETRGGVHPQDWYVGQ